MGTEGMGLRGVGGADEKTRDGIRVMSVYYRGGEDRPLGTESETIGLDASFRRHVSREKSRD